MGKRTTTKKRSSSRSQKKSTTTSGILTRLQGTSTILVPRREIRALVYAAASCFVLFAILSTASFSHFAGILEDRDSAVSPNIMGPAGALIGQSLTAWFGYASILVPLMFIGTTVSLIRASREERDDRSNEKWGAQLLLRTTLLIIVSGCCAIIGSTEEVPESASFGGYIGEVVANGLLPSFGFSGALLILGTILIAVSFLLFGNTVQLLLISSLKGIATLAPIIVRALHGVVGVLGTLLIGLQTGLTAILTTALIDLPQRMGKQILALLSRYAAYRKELKLELARHESLISESTNRNRRKVPKESEESPIEDLTESLVVVDHSSLYEPKHEPQLEGEKKWEAPSHKEAEERFSTFVFPATDLLDEKKSSVKPASRDRLVLQSQVIQSKLADFNVQGRITHVHPGPVITMYEFEPAAGIKVGKITGLQDDLAMALKAQSIRIIAPLPQRGSVGIEVPNEAQDMVLLRDLLECAEDGNTSRLPIPLGKDTYGAPVTGYIADMPHLLLAGATGTGKSVCINAILISLLYKLHPSELQLIMIDPKILELSVYEGIPHLKVPVVTDPRKAKAVLQWAVQEMDQRYRLLKKYGVRNIDAYNDLASGDAPPDRSTGSSSKEDGEPSRIIFEQLERLPKILIVIDELADLMLTAGRDIEELITRLAQKARAAGIHLLLATQRPSVDVITGLIKANFPARVSFRVSSRIDSRTILDTMGAERLLGKGDMLFLRPGAHHLQRVHGAFVSDREVRRVTSFLRDTCAPEYDVEVMEMCEKALEENGASLEPGDADTSDPLYDKAVQFVLERGQASTSMVQRAFRIGYNRAARIVDTMEQEGIVGPQDGAKPRQVIVPMASNDE